ncbi:class I SAM-dependent methyltransferase [Acinetobacter wuhouensis]|uniref:class I SAM-dependent methyltransferase n=1 Tax=Acinetobacter wuhouensis TaxID=1879050 RepID=UPI00083A9B3F|nr:class I SAM-dependent methyltransferase [Acinetobacter wuhouensis]AXQ20981.1 class I SAM-dependent methyltransferase [Acinetobacter wuhouensis]
MDNLFDVLNKHNFHYDENNKIWSLDKKFDYSDGEDEENYIYEIVKSTNDLSTLSDELEFKIKDWSSLYHFSSQRTNLLEPFRSEWEGKVVLEIGCGCGAFTRYLAENAKHVIALEGSFRRAKIARERCRGLENVTVVCCNAQEFPLINNIDTVLLIGVLEYAKKYLGENGEIELLNLCKNQLGDTGKLILAIENKLGLKYLVGAKEDHIGISMYGLNRQYKKADITTYGRVELLKKLKKTGFNFISEYYPFPDYKFPTTIISKNALDKNKENTVFEDMIVQALHKDPQLAGTHYSCSIEQMAKNLCENDLIGDNSNSFLMVASKENFEHQDELIWYYSFLRKRKFSKKIKFVNLNENIYIKNDISGYELIQSGSNYWCSIHDVLNRVDWSYNELYDYFNKWFNFVLESSNLEKKYCFNSMISGVFFEALPFNLLVDGSDLKFIDLDDFFVKDDCELGYLFYRGVLNSLLRVTSVSHSIYLKDIKIHNISRVILKMRFPTITDNIIDNYLMKEVDFLNEVSILKTKNELLREMNLVVRLDMDENNRNFNNFKFVFKYTCSLFFRKIKRIINV